MKNKKLKKRIKKLEKIISGSGIILTNPDNENVKVFLGIKSGSFVAECVTINTDSSLLPIINQTL